MTTAQQMAETQQILERTVDRWSPKTTEPFSSRMMRALIHLNAYEQDAARVLRGERPIRTDYPIALPEKGGVVEAKLKAYRNLHEIVSDCVERGVISYQSAPDDMSAILVALSACCNADPDEGGGL